MYRTEASQDGRESENQGGNTMSMNLQDGSRPTVVLVHGAFAESASWNSVIRRLQDQGYTAIAAANPLRSLSGDAQFLASILESIEGPVVLVGHSYGGSVISYAALGKANVKALVFVAAFAPEEGESIAELSGRSPGSTLGDTLESVALSDGTTDLYIRQEMFHQQFAADSPAEQAALDAVTQRPLRDVAQNEGAGPPGWKSIPSWFVFGELDKNIPLEVHRFMAERAQAREVVEIEGASHAVGVSHPEEVADVILRAIKAVE
jgi:pimeloyl-ACP methyl ester carboxylesterase